MPTPDESPAELRDQAATARRLANDLSPRDADRLNQIAHELEVRAAAIDEAQRDNADCETDTPENHTPAR